ncbi:hypothetical protein ACFQFR_09725 [Streptomyces goshikiensis]
MEGVAEDQAAVVAAAEGGEPGEEGGVGLEGVSVGEPALAEAGGEQELGGGVDAEGDQEGGGGCGIRRDEFEPGEAEQPDRGGPLAEPGGQGAGRGAPDPGEQAVQGAERAE